METVIITQKTEQKTSLINPLLDLQSIDQIDFWNEGNEFNNINTETNFLSNVYEFNDEYELKLLAPGLNKNNIEIDVDHHNVLTIYAEPDTEDEEESFNCKKREFINRGFKRTFQLPENVIPEEITADYKNGIVTLFIPKIEQEEEILQSIEILTIN